MSQKLIKYCPFIRITLWSQTECFFFSAPQRQILQNLFSKKKHEHISSSIECQMNEQGMWLIIIFLFEEVDWQYRSKQRLIFSKKKNSIRILEC